MSHRTAKLIFWSGTVISLALFLALTMNTSRQFAVLTHADKLDERVVSGKRAFERRNCNDCHTILGFGSCYAPDLTRSSMRIGNAAIVRRLQQLEVVFADTFFYLAIPRIKGFPNGDYNQRGGHFAFWLTTLGVVGMGLAFGVAGVLQTYLERIEGQPYMLAQGPIRFWMAIVAAHGLMVVAGAVLVVKHLLALKQAIPTPAARAATAAA